MIVIPMALIVEKIFSFQNYTNTIRAQVTMFIVCLGILIIPLGHPLYLVQYDYSNMSIFQTNNEESSSNQTFVWFWEKEFGV